MKTIAGTGRCGTRWLTQVLQWAGFAAGHEAVHTPETITDPGHITIDVSWLALTHHVVPDLLVAREPAGCIASLIDCGLFTDGDRYTVATTRCINLTGDPYTDACNWWVYANTRPARVRWRLDQPELLRQRLREAGIGVGDMSGVLDHLPPDRNPIGKRTTVLKFDDLPVDVLAVAADWGWQ